MRKKTEEENEKLKKQRAEERKEQQRKEKEQKIKSVEDLSKVERKLEVIDDDEPSTSVTTNPDTPKEKEEELPEINRERAKHATPVNNGGTTDL